MKNKNNLGKELDKPVKRLPTLIILIVCIGLVYISFIGLSYTFCNNNTEDKIFQKIDFNGGEVIDLSGITNSSDLSFRLNWNSSTSLGRISSIVLANITLDATIDVVTFIREMPAIVAWDGANGTQLWEKNLNVLYGDSSITGYVSNQEIIALDLNTALGDEIACVARSGSNRVIRTFYANGSSLWNYSVASYEFRSLDIAELDGDTYAEIVAYVGKDSPFISAVDNDGSLIWNSEIFTGFGWGLSVKACDIDKDGFTEIFAASSSGIKMIYPNNGTSKWSGAIGGGDERGLCFADWNGDGIIDVAISCHPPGANPDSCYIRVFDSTNGAQIGSDWYYPSAFTTGFITHPSRSPFAIDYNGDGTAELGMAVANDTGYYLALKYIMNGTLIWDRMVDAPGTPGSTASGLANGLPIVIQSLNDTLLLYDANGTLFGNYSGWVHSTGTSLVDKPPSIITDLSTDNKSLIFTVDLGWIACFGLFDNATIKPIINGNFEAGSTTGWNNTGCWYVLNQTESNYHYNNTTYMVASGLPFINESAIGDLTQKITILGDELTFAIGGQDGLTHAWENYVQLEYENGTIIGRVYAPCSDGFVPKAINVPSSAFGEIAIIRIHDGRSASGYGYMMADEFAWRNTTQFTWQHQWIDSFDSSLNPNWTWHPDTGNISFSSGNLYITAPYAGHEYLGDLIARNLSDIDYIDRSIPATANAWEVSLKANPTSSNEFRKGLMICDNSNETWLTIHWTYDSASSGWSAWFRINSSTVNETKYVERFDPSEIAIKYSNNNYDLRIRNGSNGQWLSWMPSFWTNVNMSRVVAFAHSGWSGTHIADFDEFKLFWNETDVNPIADFTSNASSISKDDHIQFTFTGSEGNAPATYQWDFGDGTANSTQQDPVHQYATPGWYTVTLTVTDSDGDSDTTTKADYIFVDGFPNAGFTANVTSILEGGWVGFTFTGAFGNPPLSFQWDFGDGSANSTLQNPMHQFNTPGNFTITLTVIDSDGDSNTLTLVNYISVSPEENPPSDGGNEIPGYFGIGWFSVILIGLSVLLGFKRLARLHKLK
ncbi:MAG: PKD domain-containing protein [Promethearchaeota archaeon]